MINKPRYRPVLVSWIRPQLGSASLPFEESWVEQWHSTGRVRLGEFGDDEATTMPLYRRCIVQVHARLPWRGNGE